VIRKLPDVVVVKIDKIDVSAELSYEVLRTPEFTDRPT